MGTEHVFCSAKGARFKIKTAFRKQALRVLAGVDMPVFVRRALQVDLDGLARPGLEPIMGETGLGRGAVCSVPGEPACLRRVIKRSARRAAPLWRVEGR